MRVFKYGEKGSEVLAIVLPEAARKACGVRENDEYEFVQLAPGAFFLASREFVGKSARSTLLSLLGERALGEGQRKNETDAEPAWTKPTPAAPALPAFKTALPTAFTPASSVAFGGYAKKIEKGGFLVIENEIEIRDASRELEPMVKDGSVMGIKGFDKKLYLASRGYYEGTSAKILGAVGKGEYSPQEIATLTKENEAGCLCVLQLLKEEGKAFEKKRGVFTLVK
ncbi:hypothetical protein HY995_02760 [Candidatus Micrarchaeota archaeon]|nr:hypothetical protein [Candidatus Micrarchaeota archaeon]